jgi:hypothetical protein
MVRISITDILGTLIWRSESVIYFLRLGLLLYYSGCGLNTYNTYIVYSLFVCCHLFVSIWSTRALHAKFV